MMKEMVEGVEMMVMESEKILLEQTMWERQRMDDAWAMAMAMAIASELILTSADLIGVEKMAFVWHSRWSIC